MNRNLIIAFSFLALPLLVCILLFALYLPWIENNSVYVSSATGSKNTGEIDTIVVEEFNAPHLKLSGPDIFMAINKSYAGVIYCHKKWSIAEVIDVQRFYEEHGYEHQPINIEQVNSFQYSGYLRLPILFPCSFYEIHTYQGVGS